MNMIRVSLLVLAGIGLSDRLYAEDMLKDIFDEGTVSGNVRAYFNTRDYETKEDEAGFALGGALRAETGALGIFKFGLGYYTAQDLGLNDSDHIKVNKRLGDDLEVLAESYISISAFDSALTVGRQKINSPLINAGDAFIVPFTFQGLSYINKGVSNFQFEFDYIDDIKNRNSSEFLGVGEWSTNRYGLEDVTSTSGTINFGATYKSSPVKVEAWLTRFSELFDSLYLRGDYHFAAGGEMKPFVGLQYVTQSDSGDSLLGKVDSNLFGVQAGASFGKVKLVFGYNSVTEQKGAFKNGAFLAPYSFSTSPIFTNNMLQTVENTDSGAAGKLTLFYKPNGSVQLKVSHAQFDFDNVVDRDATDFDLSYKFSGYAKGLSLRWRVEIVGSDEPSVEQINHRIQTQFTF